MDLTSQGIGLARAQRREPARRREWQAHGVPVHDHRFGPCTLPDEITAASASVSHRASGCYWRATDYYVFDCGGVGGGREWYWFRREERRRSRRQARRELRACDGED